jgi:hypothetical protein
MVRYVVVMRRLGESVGIFGGGEVSIDSRVVL